MDEGDDSGRREELWSYEEAVLFTRLTSTQRAALELHVMDELTDREIAVRVACSEKSVRALRRVARRRLRLLLEQGLVPPPPN